MERENGNLNSETWNSTEPQTLSLSRLWWRDEQQSDAFTITVTERCEVGTYGPFGDRPPPVNIGCLAASFCVPKPCL